MSKLVKIRRVAANLRRLPLEILDYIWQFYPVSDEHKAFMKTFNDSCFSISPSYEYSFEFCVILKKLCAERQSKFRNFQFTCPRRAQYGH